MDDIIVSISTALGMGAISIVRLSGKGCIELVNSCFNGKDLSKVDSHTINYGFIFDNEKIIDQVLVSVMRSPKTYTTEDVVEINCHGGIAATNKVLEIMILKGARLADPGEFTKRAFLNGRINLIEAEAVADLINARTEANRDLSVRNLDGRLTTIIKLFRQYLLEIIANIEVNIDYPEYEDIEEVTIEKINERVVEMREKLSTIIMESESKRVINEGIKIAIIGKPNVGKSSILNRLLDEEKAIVTEVAGTTRDIVEGIIVLNGIELHFIDTAGIRDTTDLVEEFGVKKSKEQINLSDLVIYVLSNNEEITDEDLELFELIKDKKYIIAVNKKDLERRIDLSKYSFKNIIYTDTVSTEGIEDLKTKIIELFNLEEIVKNEKEAFNSIRQISIAKECLNILVDVESGLNNNIPVDIIGIDIKRIWTLLGNILGENYDDELIDQLFSQFCLGK